MKSKNSNKTTKNNNKKVTAKQDQNKKTFLQEPKPPFPYLVEDVSYENKQAQVRLSGTLTMPRVEKPVPAFVLIAGYGPNDRDMTLMGHKQFLVVADYLTRHGIAVLRFDKRGVGQSTGVYAEATSRDFADDVLAGVRYLKTRAEIDVQKIGLIGESEGGMIASMVAAESVDVAFVVLMAGVVQTAVNELVDQTCCQMRADGASELLLEQDKIIRTTLFNLIKQSAGAAEVRNKLKDAIDQYWLQLPEELRIEADTIPFAISNQKAESFVNVFNSVWYRYFFTCKPEAMLAKIKVPVLALYGDLDWIASSKQSLAVIDLALRKAGNKNYTMYELGWLNHCMQTCKTGALAEYATIEETIAPEVLEIIADWIKSRIGAVQQ